MDYPVAPRNQSIRLGAAGTDGNEHVSLVDDLRLRHMHLIAATGSGKSTLLESMIRQDIVRNRGVCLLDPHGDHPDSVYRSTLAWLGETGLINTGRVHLIDPNEPSHVTGFNPLMPPDGESATSVIVDAVFDAFARVGAEDDLMQKPRIRTVLTGLLTALTEMGLTLAEGRMLLDAGDRKGVRAHAISRLKGHAHDILDELHAEAHDERSKRGFREKVEGPLNRLNIFDRDPAITAMIGQTEKVLNCRDVMDRGEIILANLQGGRKVSEHATNLIGKLLLRNLLQHAFARRNQVPYFVYVDECQHFLSGDVPKLLDGVRKFGVGCILSHQRLGQLDEAGDDIRNAVMGSTAIKIVGRTSSIEDGKELAQNVVDVDLEEPVNVLVKPTVVGQEAVLRKGGATGVSTGRSAGESIGHGESQVEGYGSAKSIGMSESETTSRMNARTVGRGLSVGEAQGTGTTRQRSASLTDSAALGSTVTKSEGHTRSASRGVAHGESLTVGESESEADTESTSHSIGLTESHSTTQGEARGRSTTYGRSHTDGTSESEGRSIGRNRSRTVADAVQMAFSQGMGTSIGISTGTSSGSSSGAVYEPKKIWTSVQTDDIFGSEVMVYDFPMINHSHGSSSSQSQGRNENTSRNESRSEGSSRSIADTAGETETENYSRGRNQSDTVSESISDSVVHSKAETFGTARSESVSEGRAHTIGRARSVAVGESVVKSAAEGIAASVAVAKGVSQVQGRAISRGIGEGVSESRVKTVAHSQLESIGSAEGAARSHASSAGESTAETHATGKSSTRATSSAHSEAHSNVRSWQEATEAIYENLPSAVYALDTQLYKAARELSRMPPGLFRVSIAGQSLLFEGPRPDRVLLHQSLYDRLRLHTLRLSRYAKPLDEAIDAIEKRKEELIASSKKTLTLEKTRPAIDDEEPPDPINFREPLPKPKGRPTKKRPETA